MTRPMRSRARLLGLVALLALAACAGILGLRPKAAGRFPHRPHVTTGIACTKCHGNVADGNPALHIPDDKVCTDCHTKPHDPNPCSTCHTTPLVLAQVAEAKAHLKYDHAKHLGPTNGNCMRCHDGVRTGERMRPPMATCFKCHEDDASRDGRRCDACHVNILDEGTLPETHLAHDGDWMREHGTRASASGELCETCHKASMCAGCHGATAPALPTDLRLANVPGQASVHRAGFAARHALEARSDPGTCVTCHSTDRCAQCHASRNVGGGQGARNPHPPGWVGLASSENLHGREARRDPVSCAGCHGGAGEQLCVSCHKVGGVGGNPHPPGFSSRQPYSALPCRLCHPSGTR